MKQLAALFIALLACVPAWAIERNVASQKLVVQVLDRTTGGPKTGDAANLTCYVAIDGDTSPDALGDTSATELSSTNAPGLYQFDLTQAETNGINIVYSGKSATASTDVVPRFIATTPAGLSVATELGPAFDNTGAGGDLDLSSLSVTGGATITHTSGAALTLTGTGAAGIGLDIVGAGIGQGARIRSGSGAAATGMEISSIATNGIGLAVTGIGTGEGLLATGGASGNGAEFDGGASGNDLELTGDDAPDIAAVVSIRSNTAQAGAASTITLDASASATNDFYKNRLIYLTGNTGAGQVRRIVSYNGTTKVARVFEPWATTPDNTTTFSILTLGQ